MLGIDLYKKVVIEQDKSYLWKEFTNGDKKIKVIRKHQIVDEYMSYTNELFIIDIKTGCNIFESFVSNIKKFMSTDWTEVKQPVTWQEAWHEYIFNKKTVSGKLRNETFCLNGDVGNSFVTREMFTDGTWYIGEV